MNETVLERFGSGENRISCSLSRDWRSAVAARRQTWRVSYRPALGKRTGGRSSLSRSTCSRSCRISCRERTTSSRYSATVLSTSPKISSAAAASRSRTSSRSRCSPSMTDGQPGNRRRSGRGDTDRDLSRSDGERRGVPPFNGLH